MRKYVAIICLILIFIASCAPTMKDLPKLQEKLKAPDEKTRIASLKDIGKIKEPTPDVLPAIYDVLKTDLSPEVRIESVRSLMTIGFIESSDVLDEALRTDNTPEVRSISAEALYSISRDNAFESLLFALNNDDSSLVRETCVKFIGKIGGEPAAAVIQKRLKDDPSPKVRTQAALSLGETKDIKFYDLLKDSALNDSDTEVQEAAVVAIGSIPDDNSMKFLIDSLENPGLQDAAITSMYKNNKGAESKEAITKLLNIANSSSDIDNRIVGIFLDSNDTRVTPYFHKAILDTSVSKGTLQSIVAVLRKRGDYSLVPVLISDLRTTKDFSTQVRLCLALGRFKDRRATSLLLSMLRNKGQYNNAALPGHLIWALGEIGDPRAKSYLCYLCANDDARHVRRDAADALFHNQAWVTRNSPPCECR